MREGIIDPTIAIHSLRYLLVYHWQRFEPLVKHLIERYKVAVNPYENFEWSAVQTQKFSQESGRLSASTAGT